MSNIVEIGVTKKQNQMNNITTYYKDQIDLDIIWEIQAIEPDVTLLIEELVYKVWRHFQNPTTPGVNIGQWCKKAECWELLKKRFENDELQ